MALLSTSLSVAQWTESPPGVREVIGSNRVGDSRFFSLSHARDMLIITSFTNEDLFNTAQYDTTIWR